MSEQNNNCEICGNNKEETGECFDCEIRPNMVYKECGICYESQYDKGFTHGVHCDHEVCGDCTIRINRCPFCRQPWREEGTVIPTGEPVCDECGTFHSNHWRRFVDTADGTERMVWWCSECFVDDGDGGGVVVLEERITEEEETPTEDEDEDEDEESMPSGIILWVGQLATNRNQSTEVNDALMEYMEATIREEGTYQDLSAIRERWVVDAVQLEGTVHHPRAVDYIAILDRRLQELI